MAKRQNDRAFDWDIYIEIVETSGVITEREQRRRRRDALYLLDSPSC
jgi:hypothetical protein